MFNLRYAVRELLGRYRITIVGAITGGLAIAVVALTVSFAATLSKANEQSLKPLSRAGADMLITLPPPPEIWLAARQLDAGIGQGLEASGGRVAELANDAFMVRINNSENASETIYEIENFGIETAVGPFDEAFMNLLSHMKAIRLIHPVVLLGHSRGKQTTAKIVTEETSVQPVQLTEAEMIGMEKTAEADPVYRKYAEEQKQINDSRPDENFTEEEVKRSDELTFLLGQRKLQVYNELRPDAYPAAVIPKEIVKPPEPTVEQWAETVGAIEPDKENGLLTAADITDGRFFAAPDEETVILRQDFAAKRGLKVGDTWPIFDKRLPVIGIAWPGLRQNVPDVFVTSGWLKKTYSLKLVNLLLVKAKSAKDLPAIKEFIEKEAPGAIVTTDQSIGKKISGSVVDTKKLVYGYGILINLLVVFVSLLILILTNVYRMSRRRRDIAVLMAIGWGRTRLFFQSLLESLILGLGAFFVGALATIYGVGIVNQRIKPLTVIMPRWEQVSGLKEGLGFYTQNSDSFNRSLVVDTLKLKLQVDYTSLGLIGVAAVAVIVLVGAVATVRMFSVRPSDALREP